MTAHAEVLLIELLETVEHAIIAGDWKIDGALDPDALFDQIHDYLLSAGYVQNSIDGSWMKEF